MKKPLYDEAYKKKTVQYIKESGKAVAEVARELKIKDNLAGFIISMCMALLISFLLGYLISLISFWFMNHFALSWMMSGLITIFSGSFLPLWFFPSSWQAVAKFLPFQYLGYVPAAVYLGTVPNTEIIDVLTKGLIWIALLLVLVHWLWSRAIRRLVVQGG